MARLHNNYTLLSALKMGVWLIRTKLIWPKARLFRFPLALFGKKYIDFGERLTLGRNCRLEAYSLDGTFYKRLIFGKDVQLNDNVHIDAMELVRIGNNVLIASHVFISDNSHGGYSEDSSCNPDIPPMERDYVIKPVSIGDNVWIGEGVFITMGVNIGKGSVIGAHSFVNTDIPDYSIAVGTPAKIVKKYNFDIQKWCKVNKEGEYTNR